MPDFDLNSWLDGLKLDAKQREQVASALAADESNVAYIRDSQLRQSDYSRKMNELNTRLAEEERYVTELQEWRTQQTATITQAQADAAKARGEAAALSAYLLTQGIDPTTLGLPSATPTAAAPTTETKPPDFDASKFVTREQAIALARWPVVYDQLNREHQRLFGQPVDGTKLFDEVMKSSDDPQTVFNRVFNADQRRAEMQEADIQARIEQARRDERVKVQSEIAVGKYAPTNPVGGVAPIIHQFGVQGKTNADANWQQEAMADFQTRQASHQ